MSIALQAACLGVPALRRLLGLSVLSATQLATVLVTLVVTLVVSELIVYALCWGETRNPPNVILSPKNAHD